MALRNRKAIRHALACLLLATAPVASAETPLPLDHPQLALMGTVPLYWGETDEFSDLLSAPGHWARRVLEQDFVLVPLDYLSAEALAPHRLLLMAQPRGLSAEENVALDGWVRGGGHLLLFADPLMTGHSHFAIGDRRRPQDVALLSPILTHWGLELQFDEDQPAGLRMSALAGQPIPVNLPGRLATVAGDTPCRVLGEALVADCALGAGRVLIVADAALLDFAGPHVQAPQALTALTDSIFGENGQIAGAIGAQSSAEAENRANPPFSASNLAPVESANSS